MRGSYSLLVVGILRPDATAETLLCGLVTYFACGSVEACRDGGNAVVLAWGVVQRLDATAETLLYEAWDQNL